MTQDTALSLLQELLALAPTDWLGHCEECFSNVIGERSHKPECVYARPKAFLEGQQTQSDGIESITNSIEP